MTTEKRQKEIKKLEELWNKVTGPVYPVPFIRSFFQKLGANRDDVTMTGFLVGNNGNDNEVAVSEDMLKILLEKASAKGMLARALSTDDLDNVIAEALQVEHAKLRLKLVADTSCLVYTLEGVNKEASGSVEYAQGNAVQLVCDAVNDDRMKKRCKEKKRRSDEEDDDPIKRHRASTPQHP